MPKHHLTLEFDSETDLRAYLDARAGNTAAVAAPVVAPEPEEEPATTTDRSALDKDGMPYDETIHADPPSLTAKGEWRAKRGKTDEAKLAKSAFLAKGGTVEPPADLPPAPLASVAPPAVPGVPAAPPTIPGMDALPPSAPEPVTTEKLFEAITDAMNRGKIDGAAMQAVYQEYAGTIDGGQLLGVLNTNETVRANIYRHIQSLG